MKFTSGNHYGFEFVWVCPKCGNDDFDPLHNTDVECTKCKAVYAFEELIKLNKDREKHFFEELSKAISKSVDRVLESEEEDRKIRKRTGVSLDQNKFSKKWRENKPKMN